MAIIVSIIIVVLSLLIPVFFVRKRVIGKGISISESVSFALNEFSTFSNSTRSSSLEELIAYKDKYNSLYRLCDEYHNKFFVSESYYESLGLNQFVDFFSDIDSIHQENNQLFSQISNINDWIDVAYSALKKCFDNNHFSSHHESQQFLELNKDHIETFYKIYKSHSKQIPNIHSEEVFHIISNIEDFRKQHNQSYVVSELSNNKDYFDNILAYPLDPQQRDAIVKSEDNTLVISSAGSGKTSTIVAKARYLLDICKIDPSKLLIITYTKKAASELQERLDIRSVECCTFHSLAMKILSHIENKKPTICSESLLLNIFNDLMKSDSNFLSNVLDYILHYQSLMKLEHDYEKATDYFSDRKKYGIQAPYTDMDGHIIFTRSEEEKRLCTLLTELGVNFLYETPYEYSTYTKDYRQYQPDFTIFVTEQYIDPVTKLVNKRTRRVYLEHFAIDSHGNVPKWFGDKDPQGGWYAQNRKYNDSIIWKRNLHEQKNTTLIETHSADFHSGKILDVLKSQLRKANVPFRQVPAEELYKRLVKRSPKIEKSVFNLLQQFIALTKSNYTNSNPIDDFIVRAEEKDDKRTLMIISNIIKPLFEAYQRTLQKYDQIDFTDAINKASEYCSLNRWQNYEYVLVDEFQDISVDRYNFLKALRHTNPFTKLFCVGDDWQSIYRFAGSNMQLFYKFEDFFGYTEHCKIEKTYRFCNPLVDISSQFIQTNPEQVKKTIHPNVKPIPVSDDSKNTPLVSIQLDTNIIESYHEDEIPMVQEWIKNNHTFIDFKDCGLSEQQGDDAILKMVQNIVKSVPTYESVLIIGRYNYDAASIGYNFNSNKDIDKETIFVNIEGRRIRFMSVHSAKGLEADHVILINCEEGIYGFPSLVEDDPILGYVLSEEDQYEYAEERRLFYVAITRARRHMYVLFHNDKPSPFVRELTNILKPDEDLCPLCQQGHILVIKEGIAKNGNKFTNYGCSNSRSGCDYFERVFEGGVPRHILIKQYLQNQN